MGVDRFAGGVLDVAEAAQGCAVRVLGVEHLDRLVELQQTWKGEYLRAVSEEEFLSLLTGDGLVLGASASDRLVAFAAAWFPGPDPHNYGRQYGLPEAELPRAAHFRAAVVHPDYRGHHLLQLLLEQILDLVPAERIRYWFALAMPENTASCTSVFRLGMTVFHIGPGRDGRTRYWFGLDRHRRLELDSATRCTVPVARLEEQVRLLETGYRGCGLISEPGGHALILQKSLVQGAPTADRG